MIDLLLKNCRIIDGTGSPWYRGCVAISNGLIVKIAKDIEDEALETVDCEDKYISPGFIDLHSHSDGTILKYPENESRVLQGITTELAGNCGLSVAPIDEDKRKMLKDYMNVDLDYDWSSLDEFLKKVEEAKPSTNFATGIGHGSIRIAAMGFDNRKPTEQEMEKMKALVEKSIREGAFCLSSGLIYPPGSFSDIDEMVELCKVVENLGAFYETHMRDEGMDVDKSVLEAIEVARRSSVPLEIAHHKIIRKSRWQEACFKTTKFIEDARKEGIDVQCDQYPYIAAATAMNSNLPQWAFDGGIDKMLERLSDKDIREKMKVEMAESHKGRWDTIYVGYTGSEKNKWAVGKNILEISQIRGVSPEDACMDLVLEEKDKTGEINYCMCEEDIEYIMQKPYVMIGSDGQAEPLDYEEMPHPRDYGTFPRVLAHYCRDLKLITLETAIKKMTSMPANRLGLQNRGLIKEGMCADIVVFDFDNINDTPNYENPKQACEGILRVYINGKLTALNGRHTGVRNGIVLRKEV